MDDQQRPPREGDRSPVRDRVKRAVSAGRISSADGDIRLTNVSSAQSMAELGLIVRDLDQLDAAVRPVAPSGAPAMPVRPTSTGSRSVVPIVIAVLALVLVAGGAAALFVVGGTTSSSTATGGDLPGALPLTAGASPGASPGGEPDPTGAPAGPGSSYRLSAEGIRDFLATYRAEFSTSKVVELTFYDDYVIVQVPIAGKARHSGWIYRDERFSDFGGVTANFPGADVIETGKLDVPALIRNIAKARRTLNVEDYNQTYVTLNYRPQFDPAPNVNIYVSNQYQESGYLATTLSGGIEQSYPFSG
jgi:hypothetical protein